MRRYFPSAEDLNFSHESASGIVVATLTLAFDESGKGADCTHVVYAGVLIDSGGIWMDFQREWRLILQIGKVSNFKASLAFPLMGEWGKFRGREPERDAIVRDLANLALQFPRELHAHVTPVSDFRNQSREWREQYDDDPFYYSFEVGIVNAVRSAKVLPDENFNLLCDDSTEYSATSLSLYRRFTRRYPDVSERIGTICFGDDEKLMPLQLADMFGYCLRRKASGAAEGFWSEIHDILRPPEHEKPTT